MALSIIDGTNANIDISIGASSIKCVAGAFSAKIGREFFEQTVFCSGMWVKRQPGRMQLTGMASRFASKGAAYSDPLAFMTSSTAIAFVLTADTSCTYTFSGHVSSDDMTFVAAANATGGIAYESYGAVVTAWVVS